MDVAELTSYTSCAHAPNYISNHLLSRYKITEQTNYFSSSKLINISFHDNEQPFLITNISIFYVTKEQSSVR